MCKKKEEGEGGHCFIFLTSLLRDCWQYSTAQDPETRSTMRVFFRLLDHTSFILFCKPAAFPSSELAQLISTYPVFDEQKLRNELHTVYNNKLFHQAPTELLQLLIEDDLQGTLSEVFKLLQLMLPIPAISTSTERSFSYLKRINTYLRNTCVHLLPFYVKALRLIVKLCDRCESVCIAGQFI